MRKFSKWLEAFNEPTQIYSDPNATIYSPDTTAGGAADNTFGNTQPNPKMTQHLTALKQIYSQLGQIYADVRKQGSMIPDPAIQQALEREMQAGIAGIDGIGRSIAILGPYGS